MECSANIPENVSAFWECFAICTLLVVILFTLNIECLPENRKLDRHFNVGTTRKTSSQQYPRRNPFNIEKYKIKDKNNDEPPEIFETLDLTSDEEVDIKKSIDLIKKHQLELNNNITAKTTRKKIHEKYGTIPPFNLTKPTFKDFIEKYAPGTVWEQLDKEQIDTGRNITRRKEMVSIVKGVDNTDELLSLHVENGKAKIPTSGRRFRPGKHNLDGNMVQLNYMQIHQYIIELMKQAIYQARNRMTFMQNLRNRHRKSGLYKLGFLFAKTDQAGKVFSSVAQKSFRMCNMLRQGFMGVYRPYHTFLDIAYALERMETKWFDVDLLSDFIVMNNNLVRDELFTNKSMQTPRDLAKAFDELFIE